MEPGQEDEEQIEKSDDLSPLSQEAEEMVVEVLYTPPGNHNQDPGDEPITYSLLRMGGQLIGALWIATTGAAGFFPAGSSGDVGVDSEGHLSADKARFVGVFGLMGGGAKEKLTHPEMFAWSRWQLGWLRDTQVACVTSFPTSVQLTPLATPGGIKAVVVPLTETTALVVESRRKLGYDFRLSKEGALVYKVDTSVRTGEGPILVGSTSKPPDASALLGPGEVWNSDGYSITVEDAAHEGEYVKISAIG